MAKQLGPIKLQGTIGDLTFFRGSDGAYGAKAKGGVSKERIASDPSFIRTRENGQEFGSAGKSGKVLRAAFQRMLLGADRRMVSRLHQVMMKCLKADTTSLRGERRAASGDLSLLQGFDFNVLGKLGTTLLVPCTTSITRQAGTLSVTIPAFIPAISLSAPQGATHYIIESGAAEIDFDAATFNADSTATAYLPVDNVLTNPMAQQHTLTANSTLPLFLVLAVHFFQDVNGQKYVLSNGGFDAVSVIKADV